MYWNGCHRRPHRGQLAVGLLPAFATPLGPLAGQRTLADIPRADRLAELGFELPLAGGEVTRAEIVVADLAAGAARPSLLRTTRWPATRRRSPTRPWPPRRSGASSPGASTRYCGSATPRQTPRYLVVDYKTNWLGRLDGRPLLVGDYAPPRMAEAMLRAHYPLQALLYSVAVHRLLRWRQPGYDPDRHLGGVLYLFVRGMAGPQTPVVDHVPCGVFSWRPPAALVSDAVGSAGRGTTMTAVVTAPPVSDERGQLVHDRQGLLGVFNEAGVLAAADVHTALAIGRIGGEQDERVLLALALAVRALRNGSVCIDLTGVHTTVFDEAEEGVDLSGMPWPEVGAWSDACAASPLVTVEEEGPGDRPLRLAGGLLYLERYWQQEEQVRIQLQQRLAADPPEVDAARLAAGLQRLFPAAGPSSEPDAQRLAAAVSTLSWVSVLSGGPGTGKTTTVARLLALLCDQPGRPLRIALAAPTGKAAARLEEAVRHATADLPDADRQRLGDLRALTVHRLLGWQPQARGRFRHDATNQLPHDVVVVDETSMVSLTLMARLLEAVRTNARLILVGDPDQLSSVEAGAVLADLVRAPGSA